jgi:hypothetical protein
MEGISIASRAINLSASKRNVQLADKFIALEAIDIPSISHETIRQVLKKTNLSLGKINNG